MQYHLSMRVTLALLAVSAVFATAYFMTREPSADTVPRTSQTVFAQTVQQKPFVAKGFEKKVARVEEMHANVVEALDNLDLAYGIKREKGPTGDVMVNVPPQYGVSRMDMSVRHDGVSVWTKNKSSPDAPHMVISSASGKPLTSENLQMDDGFDKMPGGAEVLRELRKRVAAANLGQEFGFETKDRFGWAKPLKLTKKECLGCHEGMKVGDTVAINAFLLPKNSTK
jgi:hypothetical protein